MVSMKSFRDLSCSSQNGYTNSLLSCNQSETYLNPCTFGGLEDNCAVGDIFTNQHINNYSHFSTPRAQHLHSAQSPGSHSNFNNTISCVQSNNSPQMVRVWDVWAYNFYEGMRLVRHLARNSRYVAVDTEFPGVVARVYGEYANSFDQTYHNIKVNIDILRPIQIGFSFFGERGQTVELVSTVQFNLKWDVDNETYAADSIQLLKLSGIDFKKIKQDGVELYEFAEAFLTSGLALNENITWVGFHSAYDFAYMMKICTDWVKMPDDFSEFQRMLTLFFPRIVDLKAMMNEYKFPKGGLQEIADVLHVPRIGLQHQAGSDAMLTGETFFRFIEEHSGGKINPSVMNLVYGLNYYQHCSSAFRNMNKSEQSEFSCLVNGHRVNSTSNLKVHSACNSGRSSPEDSLSGHKSS